MSKAADKPTANPPIRALEVFARPPFNCILHHVRDTLHEPHIHDGEWAVIDPKDRRAQSGELFLIEWLNAREPDNRAVMQAKLRHYNGVMHDDGQMGPGWRWTITILNKRAPVLLSTGPFGSVADLESMIVGRVIGVAMGSEAHAKG